MSKKLYCGLIAGMAACWSVSSPAFFATINEFSVTKNGATFFFDTFGDGLEPPNGPNGATTYNVSGTIPNTAESGGALLIDSAFGELSFNAIELARQTLRVRLLSNIDPANLAAGLKSDDTLAVTGIFSLTTPTGVFNPQYSVRFNDASAGEPHQILQLQVRTETASNQTVIRYILQDFDANTITVLGTTPFAPPAGADEILLQIIRPDIANNDFFGLFSYLDGGLIVGGAAFNTPGQGFQGENFVRAEFNISDGFVVPEPGSLALLGLGALGLGWARRRKS